ncbi:MAG: hypothetical protein WC947_10300 [Elusimicrobiota bacterium]
MPINNYDGDTLVAFLDISGFKELMRNEENAWKALNRLYQSGYEILRNQNSECRVEGIFISDSGVLFVRRNNQTITSTSESIKSLLLMIKNINEKMRENDFMLTTSIAYGKFRYQERIEFEGIEKNPIYGNAYVSAFLDNENGKPKIQHGQCRIVKKNLPNNIIRTIEQSQDNEIFRMIRKRKGDNKHYYYYWMVNDPSEIERFERDYKDAYNLKYAGMLKALKGDYH